MNVGAVRLRVSDLDRSLAFYTEALGLDLLSRDATAASLGAGGRALVHLRALAGAGPRPRGSTGLYHFAVLMPDRRALGHALARLVAARWPLQGVADHGVSEALYLGDPDGLGIELYRDRPRSAWPMRDGVLAMTTDPLDAQALLDEAAAGEIPARADPATRMGHIHLQVRDLGEAERFWSGAVGFDVMQRWVPGALFVSSGGYHHHLGLNTWGTAGAPPAPETAVGMDWFELLAEGDAPDRMAASGVALEARDGGWLARDPAGNGVLIGSA
ncbi:MAG: VOC family protein [Gammaproteobacteria bacterium]|nr:VOC family protein [Gammaproteobacteria bacterium]